MLSRVLHVELLCCASDDRQSGVSFFAFTTQTRADVSASLYLSNPSSNATLLIFLPLSACVRLVAHDIRLSHLQKQKQAHLHMHPT